MSGYSYGDGEDLAKERAEAIKALAFLDGWIGEWVGKMHRDISNEERGKIADDMCCDFVNSGVGASIRDTLAKFSDY